MKVLVSGSTGMIGSAVVTSLRDSGHDVVRLLRPASRAVEDGPSVRWDTSGTVEREGLEGVEAVVHLAGESIACRWNVARKARIRESRVRGTTTLCEALASLEQPPRVLLSASAIGYYGNRGDETLTEASAVGEGFLAEVCHDWEAATRPAQEKGIRVVHSRFGVVLSTRGGALSRMLTPFRLGLGGKIGSGRQYLSWITIDDVARVIRQALEDERFVGPVNVVAPRPVTNLEFTKTLGRVLSRPTVFPMPAIAARLVFGEMGEELLLASTRVVPEVLQGHGHEFLYPELEGALRHVLS